MKHLVISLLMLPTASLTQNFSDAATRLDRYSPEDWLLAECDTCNFVYLRDPPGYEALEEDFAWEKTYVTKKEASKGSTFLSPLARQKRNKTKLFFRNRDDQMRAWFNNGTVLDIDCGRSNRIPEPLVPHGIELSTALHAEADASMKARGSYCLHGPAAAQDSCDPMDAKPSGPTNMSKDKTQFITATLT